MNIQKWAFHVLFNFFLAYSVEEMEASLVALPSFL